MKESLRAENEGKKGSPMPDSLSPVDVEAMLARDVCGEGEDVAEERTEDGLAVKLATSSLSYLQSLVLTDGAGDGISLYPETRDASSRLSESCRIFVFDICSAVPRRALRNVASLPVWREEGASSAEESYGILPQQYITQVGEHMLALVQALEPFASDADALARANEAMSGAKKVAVQSWREFAASTGTVDAEDENVVWALMECKDLVGHTLGQSDQDDQAEGEDEDDDDENNKVSMLSATSGLILWVQPSQGDSWSVSYGYTT